MTREGVLSCVILRHNDDDSKLGATTYMTLLAQLKWSHGFRQTAIRLLQNPNEYWTNNTPGNLSLPLQQQFVMAYSCRKQSWETTSARRLRPRTFTRQRRRQPRHRTRLEQIQFPLHRLGWECLWFPDRRERDDETREPCVWHAVVCDTSDWMCAPIV